MRISWKRVQDLWRKVSSEYATIALLLRAEAASGQLTSRISKRVLWILLVSYNNPFLDPVSEAPLIKVQRTNSIHSQFYRCRNKPQKHAKVCLCLGKHGQNKTSSCAAKITRLQCTPTAFPTKSDFLPFPIRATDAYSSHVKRDILLKREVFKHLKKNDIKSSQFAERRVNPLRFFKAYIYIFFEPLRFIFSSSSAAFASVVYSFFGKEAAILAPYELITLSF